MGGGQQKRVEVEAIEWRSLHLHSINSKTTFRPPQCRERTGTYSACVLGVRLRYQRHGDHVFDDEKEGFHLGVCSVLIKIYLGKPYSYLHFCYGYLFRGDISVRKND